MRFPIGTFPLVDTVAIDRNSSLSLISLADSLSFITSSFTQSSIPRRSATGLAPADTVRMPRFTSTWAIRVEVVVPSPALLSDFCATSWMSFTPTFSCGSLNSMSLAMVTPSLTISGAPYARSSTTLRPLGPRVTLTALDTALMPLTSFWRASSLNVTSFASLTMTECRATCGSTEEWGTKALAPNAHNARTTARRELFIL
mmetsp:Transcript_28898/g.59091  ORF Transcript_28898/g.59091 Transcript_28898/m.59091 type:complete len:201 (-) Transcript_28898:91-693(-)